MPAIYDRYPSYLPLPAPLGRNEGWVPNRDSVNWPNAQWAPGYLPPGSASFQPYAYPPNGETLASLRPRYTQQPGQFPSQLVNQGRSGDLARLPPPFSPLYGDTNMPVHFSRARFNPEEVVDQLLEAPVETVATASVIPAEVAATPVEATVDQPVFTPLPPELVKHAGPALRARIDKLEAALTRLQGMELKPAAQALYERLLQVHDRIDRVLQGELARSELGRGKSRRFLHMQLKAMAARREARQSSWKEITGDAAAVMQKSDKLDQIRAAYQSGAITKDQAKVRASIVLNASPATKSFLRSARSGGAWDRSRLLGR